MSEYDYSPLALEDLLEVARFTQSKWDDEQAARYLDILEACCERLADLPRIGKRTDDIRPGLLRFRCESHIIYYEITATGIYIARILHKSMQPERHDF